jgi:hypothetical protein
MVDTGHTSEESGHHGGRATGDSSRKRNTYLSYISSTGVSLKNILYKRETVGVRGFLAELLFFHYSLIN